jgi:adenylate cyclase
MPDGQELFDAAVLFTDLRRSAELITSTTAQEFFRILNASLSAQSKVVRDCRGRVLKYIGDGLMAIFRGPYRARQAMRCARELAHPRLHEDVSFGIGVAEGRVIGGIVGDALDEVHLRQYDVVGATVHLASRLCAQADAGEMVATRHVAVASGLRLPLRDIGPLELRGFASAIDCVSLCSAPSSAWSSPSSSCSPAARASLPPTRRASR